MDAQIITTQKQAAAWTSDGRFAEKEKMIIFYSIDSVTQTIRFDSIRFSTTNFSLLILIDLICEARNLTIAMLVLTMLCLVLLFHSCLPRHLTYHLCSCCMRYFLQITFLVFNLSFVFIFVMMTSDFRIDNYPFDSAMRIYSNLFGLANRFE